MLLEAFQLTCVSTESSNPGETGQQGEPLLKAKTAIIITVHLPEPVKFRRLVCGFSGGGTMHHQPGQWLREPTHIHTMCSVRIYPLALSSY